MEESSIHKLSRAAFCVIIASAACASLAVIPVPVPAQATAAPAIPASHIRYVYPDSPETTGSVFPPNQDPKAVRTALHTVIVSYRGHHMSLGAYLHTIGLDTSKVVTVKVQAGRIAVYTYR